MTGYKVDNNNEILKNAVKKLRLRFPVAEIHKKTGYEKGSISNFLNDKKFFLFFFHYSLFFILFKKH